MLKAISSHVFLDHRLHPGLLDVFARAGAQGVELFAARQHFDYTSRPHIRELAEWFRGNSDRGILDARAALLRCGDGAGRVAGGERDSSGEEPPHRRDGRGEARARSRRADSASAS